MPRDYGSRERGGDVPGSTLTDTEGAVGSAIEVAEASFDPGYDISKSLDGEARAVLKCGYSSYGRHIGER